MKRVLSVLLLACALGAMPACTVTPKPVVSTVASFDEGGPNSGILAIDKDGVTVTPRLCERYNALIRAYGEEFVPALERDFGISPTGDGHTYRMANDALDYFLIMNQWRKMGRAAK